MIIHLLQLRQVIVNSRYYNNNNTTTNTNYNNLISFSTTTTAPTATSRAIQTSCASIRAFQLNICRRGSVILQRPAPAVNHFSATQRQHRITHQYQQRSLSATDRCHCH